MATVYKSKIDTWLALVLVAAMVASVFAALKILSKGTTDALWQALLTGGVGFAFPLIAMLSTRYTIRDRELIVRSGLFRWRIPLADITSITPTSNPIASPALSLDRLRIDYGKNKFILVSPRDKKGFLHQLGTVHGDAV